MSTIERRPQLTQTDLADDLGLGTATVGRLIDRLEKRKLVERRSDERDRRSYRLVLTAKESIERIDKPELKEILRRFAKKHRSNLPR